jgi:hypothetical protein
MERSQSQKCQHLLIGSIGVLGRSKKGLSCMAHNPISTGAFKPLFKYILQASTAAENSKKASTRSGVVIFSGIESFLLLKLYVLASELSWHSTRIVLARRQHLISDFLNEAALILLARLTFEPPKHFPHPLILSRCRHLQLRWQMLVLDPCQISFHRIYLSNSFKSKCLSFSLQETL